MGKIQQKGRKLTKELLAGEAQWKSPLHLGTAKAGMQIPDYVRLGKRQKLSHA